MASPRIVDPNRPTGPGRSVEAPGRVVGTTAERTESTDPAEPVVPSGEEVDEAASIPSWSVTLRHGG